MANLAFVDRTGPIIADRFSELDSEVKNIYQVIEKQNQDLEAQVEKLKKSDSNLLDEVVEIQKLQTATNNTILDSLSTCSEMFVKLENRIQKKFKVLNILLIITQILCIVAFIVALCR